MTTFKHAGFDCLIRPGFIGMCGYVGVPLGHPWYGNSPDVDVHGGVTFAEMGDDNPWPKGLYWIGFDTAHYNSAGVDVEAETRRLADQALAATAEEG